VHSGDADGTFSATNWIFYPGYNTGPDPTLGAWTATDLFTTTLWGTTPNGFADDMGVAAVIGDTPGQTLTQALAAAGATVPTIAFSPAPATGTQFTAFGYPAEQKYKGGTLIYCQGPVTVALDGDPSTMALVCDMTGGSSGGPWFRAPFTNGSSQEMVINSLTSYRYQSLKGYLFGPIFDTGEETTFANANTAGGDCPSTPSGYLCVDISD
jgi:hypothetical protein